MKRKLSLMLAIFMLVASISFEFELKAESRDAKAVRTYQKFILDGEEVKIGGYLIEENNYFKLRDLASILNNTMSQFNVSYDNENKMVAVRLGAGYEKEAGDLMPMAHDETTAKMVDAKFSFNDFPVNFKTAQVDGNNYIKLRDLSEILLYVVSYDKQSGAIVVNTPPSIQFTLSDDPENPIIYDNPDELETAANSGDYNPVLNLPGFKEYYGLDDINESEVIEEQEESPTKKSNNRPYEWYMDQKDTGEYSNGNCGPTAVAMVLKWLDPNSTATGLSCRNDVLNNGEWWSTDIIEEYFKNHGVKYDPVYYNSSKTITDEIDKGNIVLVCIKIGYISTNDNPASSRLGKHYEGDAGHFLLIKGYEMVDDKLYYEVYDPNSWGAKYPDTGEYMGKDRLYKAEEMENALNNWWMTVYSVYPKENN
ncbi:MAG: hypothetical protein PT956_00055 [Firmicutes bacterium]|nr:hypothetical protein [Ezakiella sp.]MDD7761040.1 hypothetical protein [Bacillota bacterium]